MLTAIIIYYYHPKFLIYFADASSPPLLPSIKWHTEKNGHALILKKTGENAVVSLVGRILERRLDCRPIGCFQKGKYGGLEIAKFHLLLGKPIGAPIAEDFDETIALFKTISLPHKTIKLLNCRRAGETYSFYT